MGFDGTEEASKGSPSSHLPPKHHLILIHITEPLQTLPPAWNILSSFRNITQMKPPRNHLPSAPPKLSHLILSVTSAPHTFIYHLLNVAFSLLGYRPLKQQCQSSLYPPSPLSTMFVDYEFIYW